MSQSIKLIKSRIRGIENTRKVTSAMEMISVAKLSRLDVFLLAIRPYALKVESLMRDFLRGTGSFSSPFLENRKEKKNIGLCLVTSDSGLCGAYNNNILRAAEEFIRGHGHATVKLICVGRKGLAYFRSRGRMEILNSHTGLFGKYVPKTADEILNGLVQRFLSHQVDEVHLLYTRLERGMVHQPRIEKLLNIEPLSGEKVEYLCEPSPEGILKELIPQYLTMKFRLVLLEAFHSEHSARTVAMKAATDNAKELLRDLTLLRNKVRQANITQDITEIISSSEALKA